MTALSIVQRHCQANALSVPTGLVGSTDSGVVQFLALLNDVIQEIVQESKFNVITYETVFTVIAAEDQGAMETLAPYGYQFAYFETFYDRTLRRALYGPLNETEWQQIKAIPNPGPFYKFRIRQDHLLINPAPTAPLSTIAFEYASSYAVVSNAGTPKALVSEDTDNFVFPENILYRGLAFYWKRAKGLPYQSDEVQYYNLLNNYIARDKVKRRINVADPYPKDLSPGIFVPSGNWNV